MLKPTLIPLQTLVEIDTTTATVELLVACCIDYLENSL